MPLHPSQRLDLVPEAIVAHPFFAKLKVVVANLLTCQEAKHAEAEVDGYDNRWLLELCRDISQRPAVVDGGTPSGVDKGTTVHEDHDGIRSARGGLGRDGNVET